MDKITPIKVKSKRQVKREGKGISGSLDNAYHSKVSKRGGTKISSHITLHPARQREQVDKNTSNRTRMLVFLSLCGQIAIINQLHISMLK
jgi:hypothetical protein